MTPTVHPAMAATDESTGPLTGLVVVDLTRALAGPHAAMMLGDLGAEVIKVENPLGGDDTRGWGPPFVDAEHGERESTYCLCANRNKKSVTLDLKDHAGKAALQPLIRRADVLMENFRPGVLDRLGFSQQRMAELNPRLVVLSISGFGHDGPEAWRAGYDQIAQGEAGLMSVTGSGPTDLQRVGVPIADLLAGMYGAFGVLTALQERHRTGRGQIAVGSKGLRKRCCDGLVLDPDAPGMATNPERVANGKRVIEMVQAAFALYSTDELLAKLDQIGVPAGRIRSIRDVYEWEQ